jgi:hypothetical protein
MDLATNGSPDSAIFTTQKMLKGQLGVIVPAEKGSFWFHGNEAD